MNRAGKLRASSYVALGLGFAIGVNAASPAHALVITPTFASSITSLSNAATWEAAINYADQQYETLFSDPITINITFQSGGGLGSSSTPLTFVTGGYTGLKAALAADSKTTNDATAVAHLPAADPTGGAGFLVSFAQAKALGLTAGNTTENDGTITLGLDTANGGSIPYTFDPNNRAVAGNYDFIGVAEHEISEVMGRIGLLGQVASAYGALDLFGYTGPGALDLLNNQSNTFFSINGGSTLLKEYNNHSNGGDQKDWAQGFAPDSYDAFATPGAKEDISTVDKTQMDVIGYDLVPEPGSLALLAFGGLGLLVRRRTV